MPREAADMGLLKAKYDVPRLNKNPILRRRLNHRLDDALSHRVTMVTAPAGYGKTTAVLKWLEGISLPSGWLSIDSSDNDAVTFWRYFYAALEGAANGISKDAKYVFESPELLHATVHLNILLDSLSGIGTDFVLVLDDFHLITNTAILDGLSYFITYMPPEMHLILISRAKPRLKLARLQMKDDLARIGAEDLRFDAEEISRYYEAREYHLHKEDLQSIEEYTEGWAAALVAVALSLKGKRYGHYARGGLGDCSLHIEDYIAEDVFDTWTKEQQDFMVKTSVLDRLCGPLGEAVTGYDGSLSLKELYEQNGFLVALDDEGMWFRYHHLLLAFLRKELQKRDAALIRELHRRAGGWLEANGFDYEAIEHFLKGAHCEDALPLIEKHGGVLVRRGDYARVISWTEKLPVKYIVSSPGIMLSKATCLAALNDLKGAREWIEYAESAMHRDAALHEAFYTPCMMAKTNLFLLLGDAQNSVQTIKEASACRTYVNLNQEYANINLYDISMYRITYHVFMKLFRSNPSAFDSFARNYRGLIHTNPGYAPLIKGEYYYESGRLEEALPELVAAVDEATQAGCPGALVPAMVTLAKIRRACGDLSGAMEIIEECKSRVERLQEPHWGYMLRAFQARLYLDTEDSALPDRWMTESRLSLYQDITRVQEYELIVLARVLIRQQRYDEANMLLGRLLHFAQGLKRLHSQVEITNLLAITAMKNLNEQAAAKHLEKALSIGLEEGYVRSFVDELSPMVSLLEMYISGHKGDDRLRAFARELLKHTQDGVRNAMLPAGADAIERLLTPAEKKVLQLILNACTNQEIAEALGITLRTVKAHAGNIYKKLEVKNRTQCIRKVRGISA